MNKGPLELANVQGMRFTGIGCCIYCGSDGEGKGLRSEHIVPYSLGGSTEILEASCWRCEGVTSYLDGYLARSAYADLRAQAGYKSRRSKRAKFPERKTVALIDSQERELALGALDRPQICVLPRPLPPGILLHKQPAADWGDNPGYQYFMHVPPSFGPASGLPNASEVAIVIEGQFNLETFARGIAKIAYCSAIGLLKPGSFRPLRIKDLILGRFASYAWLVGGDEYKPPSQRGHEVELMTMNHGRLKLVVACVRLFSSLQVADHPNRGIIGYRVVVGAARSDFSYR